MWVEDPLERYRAESLLTKEPETIAWIDERFVDGDVFVDVGANLGMYSLYAAAGLPGLTVLSFEPYYKNWFRLVENIVLNRLPNVIPVAAAIADETGPLPLSVPDTRFGASGAQIHEAVDVTGRPFEVVESVTMPTWALDDFLAASGAGVPNHVKIDVDGAERKVLMGMRRTLGDPALRSLLIEVNSEHAERAAVDEELRGFGLEPDDELNLREVHSRTRRAGQEVPAENVIYRRSG